MDKHKGLSPFLLQRLSFFSGLGDYVSLVYEIFKTSFQKPPHFHLFLKQLYDIGVASLPVVAITGFFTGLVLAAQSFYQLSDKGLSGITGVMVAKAMITELGPILTAFMVTGRVGAAMCAELGTMKVTEQVDALETMAVNPHRYLLAPRVFAGSLMMPLLTLFSMLMGVIGGYLISVYYFGMSTSAFFEPMPMHITLFDLLTGLIKSFVFGLLIMTVSCYKGMKTFGGAAGVGRATTNSVVITYCCILFTNFFLTMALNVFRAQLAKFL